MHFPVSRGAPVLLALAMSTLLAGCGCLFGRPYGPESWRELRRLEASLARTPVDREGFLPEEVCTRACPAFGAVTRGRCYPVALSDARPKERIVECNYMTGWPYTARYEAPRSEAEGAPKDHFGHPEKSACARWCTESERELNYCELTADMERATPGQHYVVCSYHRPGGCDLIIR